MPHINCYQRMQIKTIRYYYVTIKMANPNADIKCGQRYGASRKSTLLFTKDAKCYSYFEDSLRFSTKLKHSLAMQSNSYSPWYLPKLIAFTAALSITAKIWSNQDAFQ